MSYILFLFFLLSFSAQADVFLWVDEKGNRHYSDKLRQGAKEVAIRKEYTFYHVKKIYDGDTIQLRNGKKIRFLGINTPEVEGRYKTSQRGGKEAKQWLSTSLKNSRVRLEGDVEKKDKYGRWLAYVFTEKGVHINLQLIKKGLASVTIHPPNLKYTKDLLAAQELAEKKQLGIWAYAEYQPKKVTELGQVNLKGWQRIIGRVKSVRQARKYSYLEYSKVFSLRIARRSLGLFPNLDSYIGKQVEARGWVNKYKGKYTMFVRHPSALK